MGCPTECEIGDSNTLTFSVTTHDPNTGVLTDADAVPSYRIYEDETAVPILTGNMAKLDDANTTGFYTETITTSAGNGFENGKTYNIYIEATVDSDKGGMSYAFVAYDQRQANVKQISDDSDAANNLELALENGTAGYIASDMKYLDGGAQSATDLKDFADAGYDPGTNKVQGVVLTDTCTTNTDMRGTDGANTTVPDAAGTAAALHTTTDGKIDVVDGIVDDILVDTAEIGAAGIGLTAIPWNSDWDVEVNSQVSDVLKTDTIAEMTQGIPPTTPTFQQAIMYGYMALTKDLNDDGSSKDFYNNAGTVIWKKDLSDDGTDYHEIKGASGA
jgi:hypothetical protein